MLSVMNIIGISGNVFHINVLENNFMGNGEINARKNSNPKDRKFQTAKTVWKALLKVLEFGKHKW